MINGATVNIDGFVSLNNDVVFVPGAPLNVACSCICLTSASGLHCGPVPLDIQGTLLHVCLKYSE